MSKRRIARMPRHAFVLLSAVLGCSSLAGPTHPHVAIVVDWDERILSQGWISLAEASRSFYFRYPDAFDFLVMLSLEPMSAVEIQEHDLAHYLSVRNDVRGIGFPPTYDVGLTVGSQARLQGIVYLGGLWTYYDAETKTLSPELSYILAHELGHRFAAYVRCDSSGVASTMLLDFDADHWTLALDTDGSPMGGHDWRDNGDGTFTTVARWAGLYSMLDLYLMGLASPEEVPPLTLLDLNPRPYSIPVGTTITASTITKSVQDVVAVEGTRRPPCGEAPTSWRVAFMLVARSSREVTPDASDGMEAIRSFWPDRFRELTRGRGSMRTELAP